MRLVTRLTGLSADTIRAWERRYAAIEPRRSAGNTRRFSAEDVRRLVLLRDATARGHSISSIAKLSIDELERLVGSSTDLGGRRGGLLPPARGGEVAGARRAQPPRPPPALPSSSTGTFEEEPSSRPRAGPAATAVEANRGLQSLRGEYLEAVARFDSRRAYEILMRAATFLERRELVFEMVVPIIHEVGDRWARGELGVAQEHMVSSQIRSAVSSLLRFSPPREGAPQLLFATPPGHRHELGVLVGALLAVTKGLDPLYLGPDLPFEELKWAARMSKAEVVVLGIARDVTAMEAQELPVMLEQLANEVEVWLGIPRRHPLSLALGMVRQFDSFEEFEQALDEVFGSAS